MQLERGRRARKLRRGQRAVALDHGRVAGASEQLAVRALFGKERFLRGKLVLQFPVFGQQLSMRLGRRAGELGKGDVRPGQRFEKGGDRLGVVRAAGDEHRQLRTVAEGLILRRVAKLGKARIIGGREHAGKVAHRLGRAERLHIRRERHPRLQQLRKAEVLFDLRAQAGDLTLELLDLLAAAHGLRQLADDLADRRFRQGREHAALCRIGFDRVERARETLHALLRLVKRGRGRLRGLFLRDDLHGAEPLERFEDFSLVRLVRHKGQALHRDNHAISCTFPSR